MPVPKCESTYTVLNETLLAHNQPSQREKVRLGIKFIKFCWTVYLFIHPAWYSNFFIGEHSAVDAKSYHYNIHIIYKIIRW